MKIKWKNIRNAKPDKDGIVQVAVGYVGKLEEFLFNIVRWPDGSFDLYSELPGTISGDLGWQSVKEVKDEAQVILNEWLKKLSGKGE